jgi:hypothetical protein
VRIIPVPMRSATPKTDPTPMPAFAAVLNGGDGLLVCWGRFEEALGKAVGVKGMPICFATRMRMQVGVWRDLMIPT